MAFTMSTGLSGVGVGTTGSFQPRNHPTWAATNSQKQPCLLVQQSEPNRVILYSHCSSSSPKESNATESKQLN